MPKIHQPTKEVTSADTQAKHQQQTCIDPESGILLPMRPLCLLIGAPGYREFELDFV